MASTNGKERDKKGHGMDKRTSNDVAWIGVTWKGKTWKEHKRALSDYGAWTVGD